MLLLLIILGIILGVNSFLLENTQRKWRHIGMFLMIILFMYCSFYTNYYFIYIIIFTIFNFTLLVLTQHLFLVYLLLVTWIQTIYFLIIITITNISIQLIILELFSILSLFLIIISRILFKVYITWYFFSINNIIFITLLTILLVLYSQQIFSINDLTLLISIHNSYSIIDILNVLIFFKLYSILVALFFEQIYLELELFLLLYMFCIYIYFFFFISISLLKKTIHVQYIKMILLQCFFCTFILTGVFNVISLYFLISNMNLVFVFLIITNINYIYIHLYTIYHTFYSFSMYAYFISLLFVSSYSIYNVKLSDYSWLQHRIGLNFYSNYTYIYILYLIILVIGGLPVNSNFIIKLTFITATISNTNQIYTVIILSFIGATYLFYSRLFIKIFNAKYTALNTYSILSKLSYIYTKLFIIIILILNIDPFKLIELYTFN